MTKRNMAPLVKVRASAEGEFEPDTCVFKLRINGKCRTQKDCAEKFAQKVAFIRKTLEPYGLSADLKTSNYTTYERKVNRREIGYTWEYFGDGTLKVNIKAHDASDVWRALSECGTGVTISMGYVLDDEQSAIDSLLVKAMAKARASAETLASAEGMSLGSIAGIRYDSSNADDEYPGSYCYGRAYAEDAGPTEETFEPKQIKVRCKVKAKWHLVES